MRGDVPQVLIRCDVSPLVGTGHLRRCLTLARELQGQGAKIIFVCRVEDYDLVGEVGHVASEVVELRWSLRPEEDADEVAGILSRVGADVAIVDHYYAGPDYQKRLTTARVPWLQFDRFAAYPFLAKWVLNLNPRAQPSWYEPLVKEEQTQLLLGPKYALLRHDFAYWSRRFEVRKSARRVLLAFGGGDDRGALLLLLPLMNALDPSVSIVLLTSSSNPRLPEIRRFVQKNDSKRLDLRIDEPEVARSMAEADLGVISGGTLAFEAAAIGLPTLITAIADNQEPVMSAWEERGAALALGGFAHLRPNKVVESVEMLLSDQAQRRKLSQAGRQLVDGRGTERVTSLLLGSLQTSGETHANYRV